MESIQRSNMIRGRQSSCGILHCTMFFITTSEERERERERERDRETCESLTSCELETGIDVGFVSERLLLIRHRDVCKQWRFPNK